MKNASNALSVAQLLILSTAAQRPDGMVLPLPETLRARGASQKSLLVSLLKLEYVEEVPTRISALSWRSDEGNLLKGLRIAPAGIDVVGGSVEPRVAAADARIPCGAETASVNAEAEVTIADVGPAPDTQSRPGGKLGQVLGAVEATYGATLEELVDLTGWLPHTTRAALTRLRQRGFAPKLIQHDGRKAYCLQKGSEA